MQWCTSVGVQCALQQCVVAYVRTYLHVSSALCVCCGPPAQCSEELGGISVGHMLSVSKMDDDSTTQGTARWVCTVNFTHTCAHTHVCVHAKHMYTHKHTHMYIHLHAPTLPLHQSLSINSLVGGCRHANLTRPLHLLVCTHSPSSCMRRHYQFEVTTVSRVYLLGCDSEQDRASWLVDFQRVGQEQLGEGHLYGCIKVCIGGWRRLCGLLGLDYHVTVHVCLQTRYRWSEAIW